MKVHLPSPLYSYTGDQATVRCSGATLAEVLEDLDRRFPGLRFRIVDEQGEVRTHMRVFVNGKDAASLRTRVGEDDEVRIVAALSGG